MVVEGRGCSKMPCESCAVQFSMFKRKRACCECERYYCSSCLRRGGGAMCAPCRVLSTRPLTRQAIAHLKVRDLQCFLQRQNVSTRGCVEKEELLSLCVSHVNSAAYRRRGSRAGASPFSSLKGLTNNINDFINSTFDIRNNAQPAPPPPARGCPSGCYNSAHGHESAGSDVPLNYPPRSCADRFTTALGNCFNSSHIHESAGNNDQSNSRPWTYSERFTTTPGGETDIRVPVPEPSSSGSGSASADSARVDTADCFEIEDLDDSGWEFVTRPADPLPNDSDVLLSTSSSFPRRAASELDVRRDHERDHQRDHQRDQSRDQERDHERDQVRAQESDHEREQVRDQEPGAGRDQDSVSLHDAPLMDREPEYHENGTNKEINLERFKRPSELDTLNVKQLKELLTRNRVEYRGCLERKDLLERAKTLWRNHAQYNDDIDNLPSEECCKICMAAPLECVLLECGHIAACTACARQLAECPICRQYVVRAVRFFRS